MKPKGTLTKQQSAPSLPSARKEGKNNLNLSDNSGKYVNKGLKSETSSSPSPVTTVPRATVNSPSVTETRILSPQNQFKESQFKDSTHVTSEGESIQDRAGNLSSLHPKDLLNSSQVHEGGDTPPSDKSDSDYIDPVILRLFNKQSEIFSRDIKNTIEISIGSFREEFKQQLTSISDVQVQHENKQAELKEQVNKNHEDLLQKFQNSLDTQERQNSKIAHLEQQINEIKSRNMEKDQTIADIQKKVEDLQLSVQNAHRDNIDLKRETSETKEEHDQKIQDLQLRGEITLGKVDIISDATDKLETELDICLNEVKKNYLVIKGLPSTQHSNVIDIVRNLLNAGMENFDPNVVVDAYRLTGKAHNQQEGTNRNADAPGRTPYIVPIKCVIVNSKEKEKIINKAGDIKRASSLPNLWIERDMSQQRKAKMMDVRACYRALDKEGKNPKMQGAGFTLNGRLFRHNNLNSLPPGFNLFEMGHCSTQDGENIFFAEKTATSLISPRQL